MSRQIFPSSIVEFSEESLIQKHSTRSKTIYWLLIFTVILFAVSIFFVKVDVNVHSRGLITSREQSTTIVCPVPGTIRYLNLIENTFVEQGDTLLVLENKTLKGSINALSDKKKILENRNSDLLRLSKLNKKQLKQRQNLNTPLYIQELQELKSILRLQTSEISILSKEYKRQKKLYSQNVIPKSEYEEISYKLENEQLKYNQILDSQLSEWQKQFDNNKTQILELSEAESKLNKDFKNYFVTAPISGYIQNISWIKEKGLVSLNQKICVISPTEHLIVETFVSSADIGLIRANQETTFRVDAFNFNQWGMLKGKVVEIANDIQVQENGKSAFKIRCRLEDTKLSYRGKTVNVKKGMSVDANFFLSRRTLAQLLYDKIGDWIDPNTISN